jgi:hypothetical protein
MCAMIQSYKNQFMPLILRCCSARLGSCAPATTTYVLQVRLAVVRLGLFPFGKALARDEPQVLSVSVFGSGRQERGGRGQGKGDTLVPKVERARCWTSADAGNLSGCLGLRIVVGWLGEEACEIHKRDNGDYVHHANSRAREGRKRSER